MTMLLKRLGDTAANSFTAAGAEYFVGHAFYLTQSVSRSVSLVGPLAPRKGGAADASVAVGSVSFSEASEGFDVALDVGGKALPFGLPCITDEKLLMLMAQDSMNGRLAALRATDSPLDTSIDDEPATVPVAVGGSVTGVIDVAGDVDDLTVALVAGQRYMISLMGTGAGALQDSYLEIFDPSLGSVGHDDDGGVARNSVMTVTAAVSGTYTIRASGFGTSGVGQYTVDVRQMGTDSVPATIEGAVPIGEGITFGFRETDGDSDYYKVSLVAGKSYSFSAAAGTDYQTSFSPIPAGEFDTILVLRGPTGAFLTSNDDISWPSDASSSFQFQATSTGDYYLEVTAYTHSAAPGGNTGGYVIDFREVPPPDPLESIDWNNAGNIPTVIVNGVPTAYIYFAVAGENFGENARGGDPAQPASGGNGTLVSYGWSEYEKAQFMLAMQEYTKILGIAYVETANSALATFRVITNSSYTYGAYAYPQDPAYGAQKGIMVFNVDNRGWELDSADPAVTTDGLGRGGYAWHTILHEAGHAHGLAHPHDAGGGSQVMVGVTSPYSLGIYDLNQGVYTQMSYNGGWQTHPDGSVSGGDPTGFRSDAGWLATMGAFDIAVLQARYGITPAYATGDNVYTLLDVNSEGTYFETIYDTGGTDTIAYNGVRGAQIDLNTATLDYSVTGGGILSFVRNLPGESTAQAIKGGFTIANGIVIENATGGSGDDVLIGNGAANVLTGRAGNDVFMGGGGADRIDAGEGNDTLRGEAGDDILIGGAGDDDYSGGDGIDTLDFSGEGGSVVVNLSSNTAFFSNSPQATRSLNPGEALDSFGNYEAVSGIENLVLTSGNDFVLGGDSANRIEGRGGDDLLLGEVGNDLLLGASGFDFLEGGLGDDSLEGGDDDDSLHGGQGDDRLDGGSGSDTAIYSAAAAGVTVSLGLPGGAQNTGGAGVDTLIDIENLTGSEYGDILIGNALANVIHGLGGGDTMRGGNGDDTYFVTDAGDLVEELAGQGVDTILASLAVFSLAGLAHVENLTGTSAAGQTLTGNAASNVVNAGSGNDVLYLWIGGGNDIVNAGAGNDNIFFGATLTSADVVNGGAGVDTLVVQGPYGSLTLTAAITQIENVSILGGNNTNFGEPGTNRYDYVLTTHNSNFAAGVQARINGSALLAGEDFTFNGSAETDASFVVYGGKGKDTLLGGLGNDIFFYAEERFASGDTVNGGAGYDGMFLRGNYTIDFNAPGYTGLFTNIENLTLTSATDERYARGGGTEFDYNLTLSNAIVNAGQTLTISGALLMASETMILDASQETNGFLRLFGGAAADTLKGGALADLIHGAMGADTLRGGGGADTFRYQAVTESYSVARDHIIDFTPGTDKIDLSAIDASRALAGDQAFSWIGPNAFSNVAGQLRAFQSGAQWIVQGDINGDGFADLIIALTLQGPAPLGAGDFLL